VFKNLVLFTENKDGADDLFDRLNVGCWLLSFKDYSNFNWTNANK